MGLLEDAQRQADDNRDKSAQRAAELAARKEISKTFAAEVIEFTQVARELGEREKKVSLIRGHTHKGWAVMAGGLDFYVATSSGSVFHNKWPDEDVFGVSVYAQPRAEDFAGSPDYGPDAQQRMMGLLRVSVTPRFRPLLRPVWS